MSEPKKLTLEEALAREETERHNSAIGNVVCVLTAISDARRLLQKELAKLDEHEAWAKQLAEQVETDPVSVNDGEKLHQMHVKYGSARGGTYTIGRR